jgi:hypothetical protein
MEPIKKLTQQMPVRAALAVLIGVVIAFILPTARMTAGHGADIAASLVFAMAILIFARQASDRRRQLLSTVYLELNKLRRIYHIAKNLAGESNRYRSWFMEIHGNLHMYLAAFEGANLKDYSGNNSGFRRLTYHIYTAPELETDKEKILYSDLLKTTGVVAETRQRIKDIIASHLTRPDWTWLLLSSFVALLALAALADASGAGRLTCGLMIGVVLGGLDYIRSLDRLDDELVELSDRYVRNISKLQYKRRES